jgi:hypothetical protein
MSALPDDSIVVKAVKIINSCRTQDHVKTTSRLLDAFEHIYGQDKPLRGYLLEAEFAILNPQFIKSF